MKAVIITLVFLLVIVLIIFIWSISERIFKELESEERIKIPIIEELNYPQKYKEYEGGKG